LTSSPLSARRGSQTPRIANFPAYASSAADEVIELARAAGLVLDPWQCFVLRHGLGELSTGQWAAFMVALWVARQNGKGGIIEALELAWLFLFGERLILHSAHEYKTAQEAFLRIKGLIQNTPDFDKRVNRYWQANGEQGIELVGGQRLRFVARSKTSGRGFSGDKNVLDEAQELTVEQMAALLPTMSARPNPQVWLFGTPPEDPTAWVYTVRENGENNTDPRLAYFDWGIGDIDPSDVEALKILDDVDAWYAANPALGIRITEDFVAGERRMLQAKFAAERLGAWLPKLTSGSSIIDAELWRRLADRNAERPLRVAFAIDVSPDRMFGSIAMAGFRPDGKVQLAIVEHRPGTEWIPARARELRDRWDPIVFAVDARGPVASLRGDLAAVGIVEANKKHPAHRGQLTVLDSTDAATAWGMFVDSARQERLHHSDDAPLNLALSSAKTRTLGDGSAWARRSGGADISPLVAGTEAHWALITLADGDSEPSVYFV